MKSELGQGRDRALQYLRENPLLCDEIEKMETTSTRNGTKYYVMAVTPMRLYSFSGIGSLDVLKEKEEKIAPGTLLGTSHTYGIGTGTSNGTQDKTAAAKTVCFATCFDPNILADL